MIISTKWRKKLLIRKINLTGHKKVHVACGFNLLADMSHRSVLALKFQDFS